MARDLEHILYEGDWAERMILWWWWQMFSTSQMRVNQLSKYFFGDGDRLLLVCLEEVIQLRK